MKNKKEIAILVIIIAIAIIGVVGYKISTSYLWSPDGKAEDGKAELIQHIKSIEDPEERKEQVDFMLESNIITQAEANDLY